MLLSPWDFDRNAGHRAVRDTMSSYMSNRGYRLPIFCEILGIAEEISKMRRIWGFVFAIAMPKFYCVKWLRMPSCHRIFAKIADVGPPGLLCPFIGIIGTKDFPLDVRFWMPRSDIEMPRIRGSQ